MPETQAVTKMSKKKRNLLIVVSLVGLLLLTWCTMLYNDYNRVTSQYLKPAFCINFDPAYQEYRDLRSGIPEEYERMVAERFIINYGYFQGLGYSVELSGAFFPYDPDNIKQEYNYDTGELLNPFPGVLQARFYLFGKEIATVNREYPPDKNRVDDWVLHDIFA